MAHRTTLEAERAAKPAKSQKKTVNVERERSLRRFAVGDTFKPTSIRSAF